MISPSCSCNKCSALCDRQPGCEIACKRDAAGFGECHIEQEQPSDAGLTSNSAMFCAGCGHFFFRLSALVNTKENGTWFSYIHSAQPRSTFWVGTLASTSSMTLIRFCLHRKAHFLLGEHASCWAIDHGGKKSNLSLKKRCVNWPHSTRRVLAVLAKLQSQPMVSIFRAGMLIWIG